MERIWVAAERHGDPNFYQTDSLTLAIAYTMAFAILGVAFGNIAGFGLALVFHYRVVRVGCAFIRAIHELFWALIFLQMFGLSPLTGILAIAIPYSGIIAKVYAEILEEADQRPLAAVPVGAGRTSTLIFVRLPDVWAISAPIRCVDSNAACGQALCLGL